MRAPMKRVALLAVVIALGSGGRAPARADVPPAAAAKTPAADKPAVAKTGAADKAASAAATVAGKKLLAAALAAKGGRAALEKIKDLVLHGKGTLSQVGHPVALDATDSILPGRAERGDLKMIGMQATTVVADGKVWLRQGGKVSDVPDPMRRDALRALWRQVDFILLHATQPGATARAAGSVTEDGGTFDALDLTAPDGAATRLLLDPKTHLVARMSYDVAGDRAEERFAEYRPEAGVEFARRVTKTVAATRIELTYDTVKVNQGLAPDLFTR